MQTDAVVLAVQPGTRSLCEGAECPCGCTQTMWHWLSLLTQWDVGLGRRDGRNPGNLMTSATAFLNFRPKTVVLRALCCFRSSLLVLSEVS